MHSPYQMAGAASADALLPTPSANWMWPDFRRAVRAALDTRIEELIALADRLDGDCDLEDGGDLEISLARVEWHGNHYDHNNPGLHEGPDDDREEDIGDDREGDDADREPSLARTEAIEQVVIQGGDQDLEWEPEDDDNESGIADRDGLEAVYIEAPSPIRLQRSGIELVSVSGRNVVAFYGRLAAGEAA